MATQNYYEILGVDYDASADEIKRAYRRLCELYAGDDVKLRQVKAAWGVLGTARRREEYDREIGVERLRRDKGRIRQPAPTEPGPESQQTFMRLQVPARTEPGKPGLRRPAPTEVKPPSVPGLRRPAPTDIGPSSPQPPPSAQMDMATDTQRTRPHGMEAGAPPGNFSLEIQHAHNKPQKLSLAVGDHLIGRGGKRPCAILLPDPTDKYVSREHATLRVQPDGCAIQDHSANGTRVNGVRIEKGNWVKLKEGDRIQIEDYVLIVHQNSPV